MAGSGQERPPGQPAGLVIDDRFSVLPDVPLADLGGLACFQAQDRRGIAGGVVALRTNPTAPPRPKLLGFLQASHEALLSPLGHGAAGSAYWIVTSAPPGPSLASLASPWSGNGLLTHVLRPAALALDHLELGGLTHRAIRPDNLFIAAGGRSVVLGPAWAAPPAMHQPAAFEPPYSALCQPNARGDGSIADDVYALGVLLLALWTREMPLAGMDAREIIQLKLEQGSYAALLGQRRLQRGFEEILSAMLSDDPLARPTPATLANLDGIHARRGGLRTVLRATRPIAVGQLLAWNRRTLALFCAEQPAEALALLRQGVIEHWLRRSAEDTSVAADIEALHRDGPPGGSRYASSHAAGSAADIDDFCLLRLVALLDPLAPLFWRGCWLWPDGLGPLLAGTLAQPPLLGPRDAQALLDALFGRGALERWRAVRTRRPDHGTPPPPRLLRRPDQGDEQAGLLRVAYALNPYLGCASPLLAAAPAVTPGAVIAALERLAAADAKPVGQADGIKAGSIKVGGQPGGSKPLLDPHILAFLDARLEDSASDAEPAGNIDIALRELSLLARCQTLTGSGPLAGIASSLMPRLEPALQDWPGRSRRQKRLDRLHAVAATGDLAEMLHLATDEASRQQDDAARQEAIAQADGISAMLVEQARTMSRRLEASRHAAYDTASALGLLSIMSVLLYEVLT